MEELVRDARVPSKNFLLGRKLLTRELGSDHPVEIYNQQRWKGYTTPSMVYS